MKSSVYSLCRAFGRPLVVALLAVGLVLPGCASRGGRTYSDREAREVQRVQYGTVSDVQDVMIEEDPSMLGAALGGVVGGVLGSLIGSGGGRTLATVGGAAVGALGGAAAESQMRKYPASQITVETDNGETLIVVQQNDEYFVRGDRVRLISTSSGAARVQHM